LQKADRTVGFLHNRRMTGISQASEAFSRFVYAQFSFLYTNKMRCAIAFFSDTRNTRQNKASVGDLEQTWFYKTFVDDLKQTWFYKAFVGDLKQTWVL
jgi:hypothetical protein